MPLDAELSPSQAHQLPVATMLAEAVHVHPESWLGTPPDSAKEVGLPSLVGCLSLDVNVVEVSKIVGSRIPLDLQGSILPSYQASPEPFVVPEPVHCSR